jgi:hypothetical protein
MHPLTRLAVAATVLFGSAVLATSPAGAEIGDGANPPTNDEYSHAAQFLAASGGGRGSSGPATCVMDKSSDPAVRAMPAHLEWNSYDSGDGTYSVWLNCVVDGHNVPSGNEGTGFPPGAMWQVNWYRFGIVPADPEELAADAISRLRPATAGIHTDPGGDRPSMVGIPTWLWLDEQAYGPQEAWEVDGPVVGGRRLLEVRVWAEPKPDASVVWNTGDGSVTCPGAGLPAGSCTYEYNRSSYGQEATDAAGNPAFTVTASYTYVGGYEVYVMGSLIDSGSLGDIEVSSETTLAVNEAQAVNTNAGG